MIRVLHVIPSLGSGGLEQLIRIWIDDCCANGIEFIIASHCAQGELNDFLVKKGISVVQTKRIKELGIRAFIKQYENIIVNYRIDIVHVPASPSSPYVLRAASKTKRKTITHAHTNSYNFLKIGLLSSLIWRYIRHSMVKRSNLLLTGSKSASSFCFGKAPAIMLKNGFDLNRFQYSHLKRIAFRKKLLIDESDFVIGNVGRLTKQKNQRFLIKTFKFIKMLKPNSKLILLGEGEDFKKLTLFAKKLKIENDVLFPGITDDLSGFYSAMDIFVFPSLYEGLGIAAVEAQTIGINTIVSDRVPKEAVISSNTLTLALNLGPKKWAKCISNIKCEINKHSIIDAKEHGYDNRDSTKQLISIYKTLYENDH